MVGLILSIADDDGQRYVNDARAAWMEQGFELIDMDWESAINIKDFSPYYMIALTANQVSREAFQSGMHILHSMTDTPIVWFPCDDIDFNFAKSLMQEGADRVFPLPTDMEWAILNCLALIRRYASPGVSDKKPMDIYADYKLVLDLAHYSVHVNGREIALSKTEFRLLRYLMENRNIILTYEQIYCTVWGEEYYDSSNDALWMQIKNLRKKIQWDPSLPQYIKTKNGVGYCFAPFLNII